MWISEGLKRLSRLSNRKLKWFAVIIPTIFLAGVVAIFSSLFPSNGDWRLELLIVIPVFIGSLFFSNWVFGIINKNEQKMQGQSKQLEALHTAALALTMELDLSTLLQKVVEQACLLSNASYGALGVLDEEQHINQFITYGISERHRGHLKHLPEGKGVLGLLIHGGEARRIQDISANPHAVGFPEHHPPMKSFMGVPVQYQGKILGNLYLTDKTELQNGQKTIIEFTELDLKLLEMFAAQAAIAIENARLYRKTQQLVVLQERERFGMDLHDGVIQSIYAIGLMLEDIEHRMDEAPAEAQANLRRSMHGLNDVIRDIRNYILDLRPQRFQGKDVLQGLKELAQDFRANTFLDIEVTQDGLEPKGLSPEGTVEVLHIVQEALTNVRKHARATHVEVNITGSEEALILSIEDNGIGLNLEEGLKSGGNGLRNMQERANGFGGKVHFGPCRLGGTCISIYVPRESHEKSA